MGVLLADWNQKRTPPMLPILEIAPTSDIRVELDITANLPKLHPPSYPFRAPRHPRMATLIPTTALMKGKCLEPESIKTRDSAGQKCHNFGGLFATCGFRGTREPKANDSICWVHIHILTQPVGPCGNMWVYISCHVDTMR